MLQNIKKRESGFTIIEVLIVLAIAGLILVIVFLAVPNLQRNARNTSRKSEASRIASAAANFVSNNNGVVPGGSPYNAATATTDATSILKDSGTLSQLSLATGASAVAANKVAVVNAAPAANLAADNEIAIGVGFQCQGATMVAGSARQLALYYPIELAGNGFQWGCIGI